MSDMKVYVFYIFKFFLHHLLFIIVNECVKHDGEEILSYRCIMSQV